MFDRCPQVFTEKVVQQLVLFVFALAVKVKVSIPDLATSLIHTSFLLFVLPNQVFVVFDQLFFFARRWKQIDQKYVFEAHVLVQQL